METVSPAFALPDWAHPGDFWVFGFAMGGFGRLNFK
jgi:hypothetical protein